MNGGGTHGVLLIPDELVPPDSFGTGESLSTCAYWWAHYAPMETSKPMVIQGILDKPSKTQNKTKKTGTMYRDLVGWEGLTELERKWWEFGWWNYSECIMYKNCQKIEIYLKRRIKE